MEIEIEILEKGKLKVILDDRNPSSAQKFYENLPMEGEAQLWQEEISSPYPLNMTMKIPHHPLIRGMYPTGLPERLSAYSSEIHSLLLM